MPSTPEALELYINGRILCGSNARGVATSGLGMTQKSMRLPWLREEVDARLNQIMINIHETIVVHGNWEDGFIDWVEGANICGFIKVAETMILQGVV